MEDLNNIIKAVEDQTSNLNYKPFSLEGFEKFKLQIAVYVASLYIEANKTAKRQQVDTVSRNHVEVAASYLAKNRDNKVIKITGVLGGIIFGVVVKSLISIISNNQEVNYTQVVLLLIFGILGGLAVAINIFKS